MHEIAPFYRWESHYQACQDERSPFFGCPPATMGYIRDVYGYYIHPAWDYIGSETLYVKLLYVNYELCSAVIEMMGEWNDTLHNDVMFLKREVVDVLLKSGIRKFILIGENVFNFHGSDDCYYEEWFDDVEDGWIAALNFRVFVCEEWKNYNVDAYLNFGGKLDEFHWRTFSPENLCHKIDQIISLRLGP